VQNSCQRVLVNAALNTNAKHVNRKGTLSSICPHVLSWPPCQHVDNHCAFFRTCDMLADVVYGQASYR
jgi:hypothetical protein